MKATKPPTRRQIAQKTLETIRAVNATSAGVDDLHARLLKVEAWQQEEQALTGWQRILRVVGW